MTRYSRATLTCATLLTMSLMLTACGGASTRSDLHGATNGGVANNGAAGGGTGGASANPAAAAGGVIGEAQAPVPTQFDTCVVDFVPNTDLPGSVLPPNSTLGMVWGDGFITFTVAVNCPKPMTRGQLKYDIEFTGTNNPAIDISPSAVYNLAGVTSASYPFRVPCQKGTYFFHYQWEANVTGDVNAAAKEDSNTGSGVLLTASNCKASTH
jgi:hypothetical protein